MNDYMKALHQRFYQDPEDTEEEQEMLNKSCEVIKKHIKMASEN